MEPSNPPQQPSPPAGTTPLTLCIEPIIAEADTIKVRIVRDLPGHDGIASIAAGVAQAAREAQQVSKSLKRTFGLHRLPAAFLVLVLMGAAWFLYHQLLHVSQLTIGLSDRDTVELRNELTRRVHFKIRKTNGSLESLQLLGNRELDLAVVQGGVPLPAPPPGEGNWIIQELPAVEVVLLFTRGVEPWNLHRVLTSYEGQGSHQVARAFARSWRIQDRVTYVHDWHKLSVDPAYRVPADVDGVFVVKDLSDPVIDNVSRILYRDGFRLVSPYLGALGSRMRYLRETTIKVGHLDPASRIPASDVVSYTVSAYLVINPSLSPRQVAAASSLVQPGVTTSVESGFEPTLGTTTQLVQGVESALGIIIYIGLAFLAVLGLDVYTYQSRFNELNSLVSLIIMHQASRGAIQPTRERRVEEVTYLRACSDLLGLISVITGYYTQENTSLMYNRLLDVIHSRCSSMKLNIQLKILHALIDPPVPQG